MLLFHNNVHAINKLVTIQNTFKFVKLVERLLDLPYIICLFVVQFVEA